MATHTKAETSSKSNSNRSVSRTETALPTQEQSVSIGHLSGGAATPPPLNPSDVLYLQRAMGNRAVQQIIPRRPSPRSTKVIQRTPDTIAPVTPPIRVVQRAGHFNIQRSVKEYRKAKLKGVGEAYLESKLRKIKSGEGSLRRKLGLRSNKKAIDSLYAEMKNEPEAKAILDRLVPLLFGDEFRTMEKAGVRQGLISSVGSDEYEEEESAPSDDPVPGVDDDGEDRVVEAMLSTPTPEPSGGPSGKSFKQGVVSKAKAKKEDASMLYKGVDMAKRGDKLGGGSVSTAAGQVYDRMQGVQAQVLSMIPFLNRESSGPRESGIWDTIKGAIMPHLEAAKNWAVEFQKTIDPSGIVSSSVTLIMAIYDLVKLGLTQDKQITVLYRALNDPEEAGLAHSLKWVLGQTAKRFIVLGRALTSATTSFVSAILKFIPTANFASPFLSLGATFVTYGPKIFNRIRQWYRDKYRTKKSMLNKTAIAAHHGKTLVDAITKNVSGGRIVESQLDMELLESLGMSPTDLMMMGSGGGKKSMIKGALKAKAKGLPLVGSSVDISEEESESIGEEKQIAKVISSVVGHGRYDASLEKHFSGDFSEEEEESMTLLGGSQRSEEMPEQVTASPGVSIEDAIDEDLQTEFDG